MSEEGGERQLLLAGGVADVEEGGCVPGDRDAGADLMAGQCLAARNYGM